MKRNKDGTSHVSFSKGNVLIHTSLCKHLSSLWLTLLSSPHCLQIECALGSVVTRLEREGVCKILL